MLHVTLCTLIHVKQHNNLLERPLSRTTVQTALR